MSKRFVVTFRSDDQGRLYGERIGYHHYKVFPDRSNAQQPGAWSKCIVEMVRDFPEKRYCFVGVVTTVKELWADLEPTLRTLQWQRGRDAFSTPWTELQHPKWGAMKVEFTDERHRSGPHQFAYINLEIEGEKLSFEVSKSEAGSFDELARVVKTAVGSTASLAATISRQADSRQGRNQWRR